MEPDLHYGELVRIVTEAGLIENSEISGWLEERGLCLPAIEQYTKGIVDVAMEAITKGAPVLAALESIFASGLSLGLAIADDRAYKRQRAIERGRHAYEMLVHHQGNDVATLAWVGTFLREGGSVWSTR